MIRQRAAQAASVPSKYRWTGLSSTMPERRKLSAATTDGRRIAMTNQGRLLNVLKAQVIAEHKGIGYQTVLKMILHERLSEL